MIYRLLLCFFWHLQVGGEKNSTFKTKNLKPFKMKQCYNMKAFSGLIHCRINCKLEQDNHLCRIHLNNVEKSYSLWWLLFGASTHCLQTVTYHVIEIHFKSLLQGRTPSPFPLLSFSPSRD